MAALRALPPWRRATDFGDAERDAYIRAAELFQQSDSDTVVAALDRFAAESRSLDEDYQGYEHESKPFLLMRVVFEVPDKVPAGQRFSYKGWSNWPDPDEHGEVNPGWPVAWKQGRPYLEASYAGSEGQAYPASTEYRFLRAAFPYRKLA